LKELAGKLGFEPRSHDPESCVLPLDDFPTREVIIKNIFIFFNPSLKSRSNFSKFVV
jgi:hypothetical protein